MSKAVLVMDMPESCMGCPLRDYMRCKANPTVGISVLPQRARPELCPLRPLPEKNSTDVNTTDSGYYFTLGWNECLDKIMKTD